jgi:hypothetical protein
MPLADPDLAQIRPGLWVWHAYDPTVKTELFSAAIDTPSGILLVDPIPLLESQLSALTGAGSIAGVIVTNMNHQRSALDYSDRLSVPVFGHAETLAEIKPTRAGALATLALGTIELPGAVTGEIALYQASHGGTLIVGDALINLEAYGFTFLPAKYCLNQKQMRRSLQKLLPLPVERILFAHGSPIVARAGERLRAVLESS